MIFNFLLIISSVLLGSTFSKIFASILVFKKGFSIFPTNTAIDVLVAQEKSFDVIEYILFAGISIGIFAVFYFINRKKNYSPNQQTLIGLGNLAFAFFTYISVMFADFSGVNTIVSTFLWYLTFSILSFFIPKDIPKWINGKRAFYNGVFAGFFLLILLNNLTTSIALPIATFVVVPLYFYLFSQKIKLLDSPFFTLLILSFVFPFNRIVLLGILILSGLAIFITRNRNLSKIEKVLDKVSPLLVLFIFLYNPMFHLATFDSLEEGFWAGWLQRLLSGQFIYTDFSAFHPPVLVWGLTIFSKIFGASLFNLRLYFHIMQIVGMIILFVTLSKLTKSKTILIGIFVLMMAYGSTSVRNNVEIRVACAILPLLVFHWYNTSKKKIALYLSGMLAALSFFISFETGMSTIAALVITAVLASSKKDWFKTLLGISIGGISTTLIILGFLAVNGAIPKFFEYSIYYISQFANGYLSYPIEKFGRQTLIQWHMALRFIGTPGFLWEIAKISLMGGFLLAVIKKLRKTFEPSDILALSIGIFGLILSRSALGRSDEYHIAFIWLPSLLLIGYILNFIQGYSKAIVSTILCILIFFICTRATQSNLIQNQLIKFQTYGNPSGSYPSYSTKRAGIITGIETTPKEMDDLVSFITSNTTKEDLIFVHPLAPEIYFLTDRNNPTSFDIPFAFLDVKYQSQLLKELTESPPKYVIYNKGFETQDFTTDTFHETNLYIQDNYKAIKTFGDQTVMEHN